MIDRTKKPVFPEDSKPLRAALWDGWVFENGVIYDDAGNKYTKRDVQLSFDAGKIVEGYYGRPSNILNLKQQLERRKHLNKLPKVILCYDSPEGTEELVFDLTRHIES